MDINTHLLINQKLCGTPRKVEKGFAQVEMTTTVAMTVDASDLVHGGFVFGIADYAAMLAVNDPNVVLGAADVKFLKPVVAGETIVADAKVNTIEGKKHDVDIRVQRDGKTVFKGVFTCFVLERHVLHDRLES